MLEIRPCKFSEVAESENFADLCDEYALESSINGLPAPIPHCDTYRMLEHSGCMHIFSAHDDDALIGFIALLVSFNPHYSAHIGVVESFFVAGDQRKSGAGLALLRAAELCAIENGAAGMLVSAPVGGRLEYVLSRQPYRQTNSVFFRGL